jgi:hypothetical protein
MTGPHDGSAQPPPLADPERAAGSRANARRGLVVDDVQALGPQHGQTRKHPLELLRRVPGPVGDLATLRSVASKIPRWRNATLSLDFAGGPRCSEDQSFRQGAG